MQVFSPTPRPRLKTLLAEAELQAAERGGGRRHTCLVRAV